MSKLSPRKEAWQKRQRRVRRKILGSGERPRLNVYRSTRHIYAQIIDDEANQTLAFVSTLSPDFKAAIKDAEAKEAEAAAAAAAEAENAEAEGEKDGGKKKKKKAAKAKPEPKAKIGAAYNVGLLIAQKAKEKGFKKVVFDRNGFLYHGRIKAVADGARKGGLEF